MSTLVDTNVLVRHLVGTPADMAAHATAMLSTGADLRVPNLIVAEVAYVLQSFYGAGRAQVAEALRSLLGLPGISVDDAPILMRALAIYELDRLDFAEAYLVALAERSGEARIASFDRSIDRVGTVERVEPGARA